jgi:hypothetical protein
MQELSGLIKTLAPRRGRSTSRLERKTRQSDQEIKRHEKEKNNRCDLL